MILAPSLRVRMQKASESIAADTATKAGTTSSCEGTGCAIEWPRPLTYPYSIFCSCFLCRPRISVMPRKVLLDGSTSKGMRSAMGHG